MGKKTGISFLLKATNFRIQNLCA